MGDRRGSAGRGRRLAGLAGLPPRGDHGAGAHPVPGHRRPGRPRRPARRSGRSPSTSTASCPGCRTTGCSAPRTWSRTTWAWAWSIPSTSDTSASTSTWRTTPGRCPSKEQLSLLRQAAEAVSYAHRNRVVHRGLTPHAVLVRSLPDGGGPRVLVGDWQSAGAAAGTALTGLSSVSASPSPGTQESQPRYPERKGATLLRPVALDVDRRMAEAFQAPEGVWNPDADRIRIDVFALGALAYYVLSGAMPAADRTTLRERLNRDRGLDLAVGPAAGHPRPARPGTGRHPSRGDRTAPRRARVPGPARRGRGRRGTRRGRDRPAGSRAGSGDRRTVPAAAPARHRLHGDGPARQRPRGRRVRSRLGAGAEGRARHPGGRPPRRRGEGARRTPAPAPGPADRGADRRGRAAGPGAGERRRPDARRGTPRAGNGCRSTCSNGGAPTCWKPWSRWTAPGSTTGTSSPRTWASGRSGRSARTGPSTWCCSTSPCPARPGPP